MYLSINLYKTIESMGGKTHTHLKDTTSKSTSNKYILNVNFVENVVCKYCVKFLLLFQVLCHDV